MLLTISTTYTPATELGYLLHKNPAKSQAFELSFGRAHMFYPEVSEQKCTAALLLEVDPVGMVRGQRRFRDGLLDQYVNDRPFVASSFLSVAIAKVLGTALGGRCKDRPELVKKPLPLTAKISVLPCRKGESFLEDIFEPLGYTVKAKQHPLDENFPEWGESPYYTVELSQDITLSSLLTHLYVLVPVFDHHKHYYVGRAEMENLLAKGTGWLATHPQREAITYRFLKHAPSFARQALAQLAQDQEPAADDADETAVTPEDELETPLRLNDQRLGAVLAGLKAGGAQRVLDLGCGDGKLLRLLMKEKQFTQIFGMDVSIRSLEVAQDKLRLDRLPRHQQDRVRLLHGSLMYRDKRLEGFDAAAVVEVIEHLDPPRLKAFERVLFEFARPNTIVLTTPNREYNVLFANLKEEALRHGDHRFEWTRAEFQAWAESMANSYGYAVRFLPVGSEDAAYGAPTQMAIFSLLNSGEN
ncbi:MAG: 3' terminal RNA ribose 2'-O-methyltransferase Hen1 [Sedimentisphaerales bacterium]|nr:3' terminal RNA ribose 2'-O-methyltransferase Hen1 [Sedimentisphaerales bacterium]